MSTEVPGEDPAATAAGLFGLGEQPRRRRTLLLVEPQFVMRRTVTAVARELDLADIVDVTGPEAALQLMASKHIDGLLLDMGEGQSGLELVRRVRSGGTSCLPRLPVALMAETCDAATVGTIKSLEVQRLILKPFKVKTVLEVIETLARS